MASELLRVPEENLLEVIGIIRAGLKAKSKAVSKDVREALEEWCDDEEEYMTREDDNGRA